MDRPRNQLLAGTGLAEDENGGVCWGDLCDLREDLAERRGGTDDLLEHRSAVDVFAQRHVLITRALFGPLAIVDVGARRVPAQRLTELIPYRVVLHEEPPVLAIVSPSALLELERHATRERVPTLLPKARHVFRMKHARAEVGRGHLINRETDVLEQRPIAVDGLPIGTQDGNRLRDGVDDLSRLLLRPLESLHEANAMLRRPDRNPLHNSRERAGEAGHDVLALKSLFGGDNCLGAVGAIHTGQAALRVHDPHEPGAR